MASGFSGGSGGSVGSILGYYSPSWLSVFGGTGSLGGFIQEAQLDDFLYSFPAPKPKLSGSSAKITTSAELPGSTHWDPATIPVGQKGGGGSVVVNETGIPLPSVGVLGAFLPHVIIEDQPPIIYSPPPILLPGQTDPGGEEHETQEQDGEMAHTWTHVGSQLLGALFPSTVAAQSFVAGPGQVGTGNGGGIGPIPAPQGSLDSHGVPMYTGSCPPRKTRTLTIDCATGQEIPRKRRRRRALLTQGDMGVLFQIASLPNNANVRVALAGAIRR